MANTQDEQNIGKIEEGIDDLLTQSKDELEKEASLELQRQMGSARRDIARDIESDIADNIYQGEPPKGIPLTLDDKKKNVRDRSIRQTDPGHFAETHEAPDKIYRPGEEINQPAPKDMFDDLENEEMQQEAQNNLAQGKDEKGKGQKQKEEKPDTTKDEKEKTPGKEKGKQDEVQKTNEEAANRDKTPEWQKQEPSTAEGGMARADTGDISPQKKKEEKPKSDQEKQGQEEQNGKDMNRQKQREKRAKEKKEKRQKTAEEAVSEKETEGKEIGKMSPIAFIFWIFLAVICDLGSLIPYVGLIFSWPFAAAFASYKWIIKIKKEVAIATTALDFILEGLLSTLPVNTFDVIITFIVSNNKIVRKVTKKIAATGPKK